MRLKKLLKLIPESTRVRVCFDHASAPHHSFYGEASDLDTSLIALEVSSAQESKSISVGDLKVTRVYARGGTLYPPEVVIWVTAYPIKYLKERPTNAKTTIFWGN